MTFYTDAQLRLQARFDSTNLAERVAQATMTPEIDDQNKQFIESRDYFFLSTVNAAGEPTVSHKGGGVGIVTVADPKTLVFPNYDGNGMFMSMGNIDATAKIGLLFMDFETPHRVRVQATATVGQNDPLADNYPGANLIVRATVDTMFINCARYIHPHQRLGTSKYVPDETGAAPRPSWKRIDGLQDALPAAEAGLTEAQGGTISMKEYGAKVAAGES